jgi:long-chain acyl-CoA synthetase
MLQTWLDSYPPGVPAGIADQAQAYDSLVDILEESCTMHTERVAYTCMGVDMTYAQLDTQSRNLASWLQSVGVAKGDRVALMMPNILQYPVCLFGVLRIGAVVVNTNPLYTPAELVHQLKDSGAETIVIAENFAHTLEAALAQTDVKRIVITSLGELLGPVKGALTDLVVRYVKKLVPAWSLPNTIRLKRALALGGYANFRRPHLTHDDLAFLQYTGGTTGVAKGAMLSHGNMVSNLCQAHAWVTPYVAKEGECVVTAIPLYHIFALTANCLTYMKLGGRNLLIVNPRDIPAFIKEMGKVRFTAITGVNTLFNALLNHPNFAHLDFSSMKFALGGGMAVQAVVAQRWLKVTGKPIAQAYGLTETSPAVTINPLDKTEFDGSIGLPVPSTELTIRDSDHRDVPQGESGEICVRGPQVTAGYWNQPEETALAFDPDGFLMTGDIGYINERGYVFILDRKKDMILVSGFNVHRNEVEAAAMHHPGIREVAAIGVPDAHSGEAVKLFVIRKDPTLTEQDIIAHCHKLLTGYKTPKHVEFRDDLPRSNIGKVLRRKLKEESQASSSAV